MAEGWSLRGLTTLHAPEGGPSTSHGEPTSAGGRAIRAAWQAPAARGGGAPRAAIPTLAAAAHAAAHPGPQLPAGAALALGAEHTRRLRELLVGSVSEHARDDGDMRGSSSSYEKQPQPQMLHGGPAQQARMQQAAPRPRRLDLGAIPMLRTPSKQPSSSPGSGGGDCGSSGGGGHAPPAVNWRDAVERARAAQQAAALSGAQMLTDSFGWVGGLWVARGRGCHAVGLVARCTH